MSSASASSTTPVLVGVGIISQREEDPSTAREPIDLMIAAAQAAGNDAGIAEILNTIDRILVPVGRWAYANPGGMVAEAIGSPDARSVSVHAGISQQTILSDAASAIANGTIETALVVGGEAGYRIKRAKAVGVELEEKPSDGTPDEELRPDHSGILSSEESEAGLGFSAVNYYAILESAWRYQQGMTLDEHQDHMANRYRRFSEIAVANPHGWDTEPVSANQIVEAPTLAYPYGKHHVSNWSVDQASALLLCSEAHAEKLGIAREKWIYPQAFTEANHALLVRDRDELHRCRGAEIAGQAALEAADCPASDLDFIELYTCFPIAVETFSQAIGLSPDQDVSITGAMPFGGGPFNNFVLHGTAQLAEHLRAAPGSRGLISTVSGFLTKQGFAIWGTEPAPDGLQILDVSDRVAAATPARQFDADYEGEATIAGYTVLHDRQGATRAVVIADLPGDGRTVAWSDDSDLLMLLETEEFCGRRIRISDRRFEPA